MRLIKKTKELDSPRRALILETDSDAGNSMKAALEEANYVVELIESYSKLVDLNPSDYDMVVLNVDIDVSRAISTIEHLKILNRSAIILVTGDTPDHDSIMLALNAGAHDYIVKPFNKMTLATRISTLSKRRIY